MGTSRRAKYDADPTTWDLALADAYAVAVKTWPEIEVSADDFGAWLASKTPEDGTPTALCMTDLYLTCACARGDATALATFERHYLATLRARPREESALDDLKQVLRRQLFVPEPGARAKIAEYAGTGALKAWLHVLAVRAIVRLERRREVRLEDDALANVPGMGNDPELRFLKESNRLVFKEAFAEALASLDARTQNVLRQHYIDGLSIDQLGLLHDTHRTTAARWLREGREALMTKTKKLLMKKGRLSSDECESMLRDVQSQLDLSIRTLLHGG